MKSLFASIFAIPLYYWKYRVELWDSFFDEVPFVHRVNSQSDEIWLPADRYQKEGRWQIQLPQRCVKCGKWVPEHQATEDRGVDDYSSPALTTFLGVLVGGLLGRYVALKWLPISILIGVIVGYFVRQRSEVNIQYRRCPNHVVGNPYPRLRLSGEYLVVKVGDKNVRKDFRGQERDAASF